MSQSMGLEIDGSQQRKVLIAAGISTGFSTLVVILRFISRFYITKLPGVDDWLMLLGLIALISLTAETFVDTHYGLGFHLANFDISWYIPYLKLFFSAEVSYHVSMTCIKVSILSFYLRFCTITKRLTWVTIILVIIFAFINILVLFVQCIPLHKYWDQNAPGSCKDMLVLYYFSASYNIATDIAICILPIKAIVKMHKSWSDKIKLICLFGVMLFACIISCVRLQSITAFVYSKDSTWEVVELNVWSHVEIASAIFCACIPALRAFFVRKKEEEVNSIAPIVPSHTSELKKWEYDRHIDGQNTTVSTSF